MIILDLEDVKLRTIANLPTRFNEVSIQPKSIREIIEFSYSVYNKHLSTIALKIQDLFNEDLAKEIPESVSLFEVLLETNNNEFIDMYLDSFRYFVDSKSVSFSDNQIFFDDKRVHYSELSELAQIIKIQNCLAAKVEEAFNPLNERARKIKEKMLANQKKIQELNSASNEDETLTLLDLISILCSNANGINMSNVFDLNMFQFSDQFNRMKMIDEYGVNIQALLHGADSKEIKLKHWISKMK